MAGDLAVQLPAEQDGTDDPELVASIEDWGYESIWAQEGQGKSAFGKLERWSMVTDEIRLGTGIVNVFSRSPTSIAQSIATLDEHSNGRAILGLGTSHPGVVTDFHGIEFERPLARMVEYITIIRRYLKGVSEPFDGDFYSPNRTRFWELFDPIRETIPIYNGAIGEKNIRLTGQYADGWLPTYTPRNRFPEALSWLAEGAQKANRDVDEIDIRMLLPVSVHEDRQFARRLVAKTIAKYLRDIPGYYDRVAEESGFGREVATIKASDSTNAAIDIVSDDLIDSMTLAGTPQEAKKRLSEYYRMGVDTVQLEPVPMAKRTFVEDMLEYLAPT